MRWGVIGSNHQGAVMKPETPRRSIPRWAPLLSRPLHLFVLCRSMRGTNCTQGNANICLWFKKQGILRWALSCLSSAHLAPPSLGYSVYWERARTRCDCSRCTLKHKSAVNSKEKTPPCVQNAAFDARVTYAHWSHSFSTLTTRRSAYTYSHAYSRRHWIPCRAWSPGLRCALTWRCSV